MKLTLILLIAGLILISWLLHRSDRKTVRKMLDEQAVKRNGRVRPAALFTYPQLYIPYHEVEIFVSAMPGSSGQGGYRPATTFAQFYLDGYGDFRFQIRNKSFQTVVDKLLGQKDFETGHTQFDNQFFVRSDQEGFMRSLMNREVQDKLLQFNAGLGLYITFTKTTLYKNGRLILGEERPRLDVSIQKISAERREYDLLIEATLLFHDRLQALAGSLV